jgi:hypothetical protein
VCVGGGGYREEHAYVQYFIQGPAHGTCQQAVVMNFCWLLAMSSCSGTPVDMAAHGQVHASQHSFGSMQPCSWTWTANRLLADGHWVTFGTRHDNDSHCVVPAGPIQLLPWCCWPSAHARAGQQCACRCLAHLCFGCVLGRGVARQGLLQQEATHRPHSETAWCSAAAGDGKESCCN